jgi:hypothetical protein
MQISELEIEHARVKMRAAILFAIFAAHIKTDRKPLLTFVVNNTRFTYIPLA